MRIMDYNRVIKDLNGLSVKPNSWRASAERFTDRRRPGRRQPARVGEFGMYLGGRWRTCASPSRRLIPRDDPVGRLDVSLLQDQPDRADPRHRRPAPRQAHRFRRRHPRPGRNWKSAWTPGEMAVAFALHATSMEDLMAVADANEVMPPKSTWFEPKLADGLASHCL
jgi:uncharacterized protein (DUF1015 family)